MVSNHLRMQRKKDAHRLCQEDQMSYQPIESDHNEPSMINIRKLAALDMVFHSPKLILVEFALGVFGSAAFALVVAYPGLSGGHFAFEQILAICYALFIALNYAPLLLYAISIMRRGSAQEEVAFELAHKERYARKYTGQSFLLLLPLVVPILALSQEWRKRRGQR
jgi:hypothetical protein